MIDKIVFQEHLIAVLSDIEDTLIRKNRDYGDSFQKQFKKYGMTSVLIRMGDKMERLDNLVLKQKTIHVKEESIEDTVKDLAGYAILTLIALRREKSIQSDVFNDLYPDGEPAEDGHVYIPKEEL